MYTYIYTHSKILHPPSNADDKGDSGNHGLPRLVFWAHHPGLQAGGPETSRYGIGVCWVLQYILCSGSRGPTPYKEGNPDRR